MSSHELNAMRYWRLNKGSKVFCGITGMLRCWEIGLWPWKNELTSGAYGGFLQAYGGMPLAPLAWGLFGQSYKMPFIRLGWSSPLHIRAGVKRTCQDHVLYLFKGPCRWYYIFQTIHWTWHTLLLLGSQVVFIHIIYMNNMKNKLGEACTFFELNNHNQ